MHGIDKARLLVSPCCIVNLKPPKTAPIQCTGWCEYRIFTRVQNLGNRSLQLCQCRLWWYRAWSYCVLCLGFVSPVCTLAWCPLSALHSLWGLRQREVGLIVNTLCMRRLFKKIELLLEELQIYKWKEDTLSLIKIQQDGNEKLM